MRLCIWNDCCEKHRSAVLKLRRYLDVGNTRKLSGSEYATCIIALHHLEESYDIVKPAFCIKRILNWFRRHK